MSEQQPSVPPHWQKVMALIDLAKNDESIRQILQAGTSEEKLDVLANAGIELDDIAKTVDDLALLGDSASIHFWLW
jgi:hypothetical protein